MIGLAILAAVLVVAVASFRNLAVPLVAALLAYVAVPEVQVWTLALPGVGGVNIGVLVITVTATLQIVFRARTYLSDVLARPALWTLFAVWVAGGTITNFIAASGSAPAGWIEIVLAPPLTFLLAQRLAAQAPAARTTVARAFVAIAAIEALVALLVWTGVLEQPFAAAHETYDYWWDPEFTRALGTTDHPLSLGIQLLVATALLGSVRRNVLVVPLAGLFVVTLLVTEARGSLALALVAFVVVLVRRRIPFVTSLGLVLAVVASLTIALVTTPELTTGFVEKLGDDSGSANARLLGLVAGLPLTVTSTFVGGGQSTSFEAARSIGLGTSFENPLIMLALDWGLVGTLALVAAQVLVIARNRARGGGPDAPGAGFAAVAVAAVCLTFSSYALTGGLAMFVWLTIGLAIPRPSVIPPDDEPLPEATSARPDAWTVRA